ncbi:unnamed protein product [Brassicogethes aeneus]|uniref:Guanine nucleotide-binding protein G(s) subunit alpha n=1 Tax=Brassicogethes aeneus TaxID=1431903 RepID=A0A9P0AWM4_BRAAE|nr:unnamed protein product [Brassicogethes aeneus]
MGGCFRRRESINNENQISKIHTQTFFDTNKLLLLGTGESGKTTIIKQMKILHINGFSNEEKLEKIKNIKQNIHESIYDIVFNMNQVNPPTKFNSEEALKAGEYILNIGKEEPVEYTEEYYDNVKTAWADEGVQETFRRSNEFQLIDSAQHFLDQVDIIRKPDYIPTVEDILVCRVMTVQISKIEFSLPVPKKYGGGLANFFLYDVGGQRGQRKQWIKVFDEAIQAILFLIAASDFDLTLREDGAKNRLKESFELFQNIYKNQYLQTSGLIVFLNKQDILEKKIKEGRKLEPAFPEFKNYEPKEKDCNANDYYEKAKYFMRQKIYDIAQKPVVIERAVRGTLVTEELPKRKPYIHFTVATNTKNIKKVFDSVQEIILERTINLL